MISILVSFFSNISIQLFDSYYLQQKIIALKNLKNILYDNNFVIY